MKLFDDFDILTPVISFIFIALICLTVFVLCNHFTKSVSASDVVSFDNFEIVCDSDNQIIYRCVNTDVLYLWSKSGYAGGLTVMYNSDATVLTYDKWLEYESLR